MGTKKVTEKIIDDARKDVQRILKEHEHMADNIREDREKRIAAQREHINAEAEKIKKNEITRALSRKKLEYKKALTAKKRMLIMQFVNEAILSLPQHKGYIIFIKEMIKKSGQTNGVLTINTKDWKLFQSDLQKFFQKEKMDFDVRPATDISGGVTIELGKKVFHGSLDLIVELLHDELMIAVSKELF